MKAFLPAAVLALCAALPAAAADQAPDPTGGLTLAQTIETVLAHHPTLTAAQAAIDAARARTEQSSAGRLPQVSLGGDYTYMSLRPYVAFNLPGGPSQFYENINNSYDGNVAVRQLLTDFGHTDALVALARAGEISARDALAAARQQLGYQTIQAFYGVLLLRESVGVADEEIRALQESGRVSSEKFANGSATKFDVLTTSVRLAEARNRRTDIVASLQKEEAGLRELLGTGPDDPLRLAGRLDVVSRPLPDLSATIAEGLRDRPEMHLAQDDTDAAERRLEAADRERRPVVAAQASGGIEDGMLPDMYQNKGYVTAQVGLSLPLFTGRRITGERIEARADLRASQARVQEAARTIATDVESALADLGAAQARLANADLLVDQAAEALSLAQTRYANGVITNYELLDAQSAARSAELSRLQARYDCLLARQALARAAGRPPQP